MPLMKAPPYGIKFMGKDMLEIFFLGEFAVEESVIRRIDALLS